jgi:hypothetical protein
MDSEWTKKKEGREKGLSEVEWSGVEWEWD